MATEKDIKQFFGRNRPSVSAGSDTFMEEFRRQVDLLPIPAKFQRHDGESEYAMLKRFEEKRCKSDILTAVLSFVTAAVVCIAFAAVISLAPDIFTGLRMFDMIMSYPYISIALIFIATTLISFKNSDFFKI